MSDVLSQSEVESLLNAMDPATPAPTAPVTLAPRHEPAAPPPAAREGDPLRFQTAGARRQGADARTANDARRVRPQLRGGISALLRSIVEVKLTSVDQLTYSEFVFSLENPTCFNLINAKPLEGQIILDINPSLLFPIIDRLLGGGSTPSPPARRPLTEIELRLVGRITELFLKEMQNAWENVLKLELSVDRVESNPQLVQIVPPNEVVILISFELTLGEVRGMINLCIPFNAIERISQQLSANSWVTSSKRTSNADTQAQIGNQLAGAVVQLVVELADTKIATADLIGLRVGDIIATEKDINTPLVVAVEGKPKYYASAGALKGRKAAQVTGPIDDDRDAA